VADQLSFGAFLVLDEASRARLYAEGQPVSFAPGAALLREGDIAGTVYAVLEGRLSVTQGTPPTVVATPSAPVLVGEMAVLTGERRSATVTAVTKVRAWRFPALVFAALVTRTPGFAEALAGFAAVRNGNNFLRRSSPFADLPAAAIEALAARLAPASFEAGTTLMSEGEPGDDAYLLRAGEVDVYRGDRIIAALGPGSFVGEVSALTGAARTATVRARTPVSAFRLRGEDVRPILKRHRDLVSRLEGTMQSRHIPRRAGDTVTSPAPDDPGHILLRDAAGSTYLKVTLAAVAIFNDIDGERTLRDLAMRHFERTGALDPAGVFATVATLQAAGLVTAPRVAGDEPDARLMRALDAVLAPRIEIASADALATTLHRRLGWACTRAGAVAGLGLGVAGLVALAADFRQSSPGDFGVAGLAVAFVGLLLAGIGHEIAHAIAAKAEGRRVGKAGLGVLWLTPVVYVDTSDAWLIPAARRIRVNAAGPLFNFALAGVFGLASLVLTGRAQDVAIWLAIANLISVAFNLSPLLEFDGYYVLEDLAKVNGLRRKSLRFVFKDLAARPRGPATRLERGLLAYAAAAIVYVLVMSLVVLAGVPALVNGIFADRLSPQLLPIAGGALALILAALQVAPFVSEVLAARSGSPD
jgi:putative peptide zinc metalloprotease protein